MNKPIEFFFDFVSPYGWFAAERIGGIARAHDRTVAWKPLLLGVTVKQAMGLPALLETPLKGRYLLHDAERCARLYGLPWRPPTPITFSSVAAERAVVWAVARDLDVEPLVLGLYRRAWAEARDISTPDAVADVAASIGFDRAGLRAGIECPETKAGLRSAVADAVARGFSARHSLSSMVSHFGAPTGCQWLSSGWNRPGESSSP
jgi:2-hydroxychromene-2-carboxylate isomerase